MDENDNPVVQGQENNANPNEVSVNPPADGHDSEELSVEELNKRFRNTKSINWLFWTMTGMTAIGLIGLMLSLLSGDPKPMQDYFKSKDHDYDKGGTGGAVGY